DPRRFPLRPGAPRRALLARIPDFSDRPDQPGAHSQFHWREGAVRADILFSVRRRNLVGNCKEETMSRLKAARDAGSIDIIGASEIPKKVGGRPVHYLDKFGFKGRIFPINPSRAEVQSHKCYKTLDDLPQPPEMVIVAVAGDSAIGAVE